MRRFLFTLGAMLGLSTFAGCLELTQDYTINPDGSGKVVVDTLAPSGNQFAPEGAPKPPPAEQVKQAVSDRVTKAQGVEAWSDVSCEVANDGRIHFKGTAYFPDINKVKLDQGNGARGGGGGGKESDVSWAKNGDTITLHFDTNKNQAPPDPNAAKLTDAQVDEKVKEERMQYQQFKPMMQAFVQNLKISMSFTLPGKITDAGVFKQEGNKISFSVEGKQILEAMDKANADDAAIRAKVKGDPKPMEDAINAAIFGKKGSPDAKITGATTPLFDYKVEAAKAKAGQAEMLKKLGVEAPM